MATDSETELVVQNHADIPLRETNKSVNILQEMITGPACMESLGNVTFRRQRTESETPREYEHISRGRTADKGRPASRPRSYYHHALRPKERL